MSQKINHDYICSCLDESIRIMGLTIDEFVPAFLIFFIAFFSRHILLGFVLMGIFLASIKKLKKGYGTLILWILLYKNSPSFLSEILFKDFPLPSRKLWW